MDKPDIKDFDDYAAVLAACGCCPPEVCGQPILETEKIEVQACGLSIPTHPNAPDEDKCKLYSAVTSSDLETQKTENSTTSRDPEAGVAISFNSQLTNQVSCSRRMEWVTVTIAGNTVRQCQMRDYRTRRGESTSHESRKLSSGSSTQTIDNYTLQLHQMGPGNANNTIRSVRKYTDSARPDDTIDTDTTVSTTNGITCPDPNYVPGVSGAVPDDWNYADGVFSITESTTDSGSNDDPEEPLIYTWSNSSSYTGSIMFTEQITIDSLTEEVSTREGLSMWEASSGAWSSVEIAHTYAEEEEEGGGEDPDEETEKEPICSQVQRVVKARHRFRPPPGYTRSYYEVRAQAWFFPEKWEAWDVLRDIYAPAKAAYDAWVDAGSQGEAPFVPENPGPEPTPKPNKIADITWTRTSGVEHSPWYSYDIPSSSPAGQIRICNVGVKCVRSKWGTKLRFIGELYNPDGTEEV